MAETNQARILQPERHNPRFDFEIEALQKYVFNGATSKSFQVFFFTQPCVLDDVWKWEENRGCTKVNYFRKTINHCRPIVRWENQMMGMCLRLLVEPYPNREGIEFHFKKVENVEIA